MGPSVRKQVDELVQFRKANSSIFGKGWHNFSVKLMMELIPELYATSEETNDYSDTTWKTKNDFVFK